VFLDDAVLAVNYFWVIEDGLFDGYAFVRGVVGEAPEFGRMEESLGRDAADVKTGTSEFGVLFDDGSL
jgi:hypothetical protein